MKAPGEEGSWTRLDSRCVFRITGPDRARFLNGQVTNDVSGPIEEEAVAACLCSIKGKVEALVWISSDGDSILLDGQLEQREEIFHRLDRYLIADDCEIHDETGQRTLVHHFLPDGGGVKSRRSASKGWDLWLERDEEAPFAEDQEVTEKDFHFQQLLAGVPEAPFEITGDEFPAELGIDRWAVDFQKGCYLGQEVISRIESVGRVKRRLVLVRAEAPLERDATVRISTGESGSLTRPTESRDGKNFYSLVLFRSGNKESQLTHIHEVAAMKDDRTKSI